jgi:hypothetical protein
MSGDRTKQEASAGKKPGTRKFFYGSIGLILAGLLLLAIGAVYSLPVVVGIGILGWLGAGLLQLAWLQRKVG